MVVVTALLGWSLAARVIAVYSRTFHQDEFQLWYIAWLRSAGASPGLDFYMPSYYVLADLMAPLFFLFPSKTSLFLSRSLNGIGGVLVLALVAWIATRLTSSIGIGLFTALAVSLQTDFAERIVEVRSDTLNALFVLLALLFVSGKPGRKSAVCAGLALGVACLCRFKMVVGFVPVLLLGFVLNGRRWSRRAFELVAASTVPPLTYLGLVALAGEWREFWIAQGELARAVSSPLAHFSPFPQLALSFSRNSVLGLLILASAIIAIRLPAFRNPSTKPAWATAAAAVAFFGSYVWLNPGYFPYNFVDTLPVLALTVPAAAASSERWKRMLSIAAPALAVAMAIQTLPRALVVSERNNAVQLRYLDYLQRAIRPSETVFDMQGTHLFRRGPFHWLMTYGHLERYRTDRWFSIPEELRRSRVSLVVPNYRFDWLPQRDRKFVADHYVPGDGFLLVPGHAFRNNNAEDFEILVPGRYRFRPDPPRDSRIDGAPVPGTVLLDAGRHRLTWTPDGTSFDLFYTTPERESTRFEVRPGEHFLYVFD